MADIACLASGCTRLFEDGPCEALTLMEQCRLLELLSLCMHCFRCIFGTPH